MKYFYILKLFFQKNKSNHLKINLCLETNFRTKTCWIE
jgi:hypothetical protein